MASSIAIKGVTVHTANAAAQKISAHIGSPSGFVRESSFVDSKRK